LASKLSTPVVLFAFNRPELTAQVFEVIRKAKPEKLFVIIDGPRANNSSDIKLSKKVKEIVSDVDWDCDAIYEISDTNMGIRKRFVSGLGSVFSKVEEAIIVEDDCLPNLSFFHFQQEMLAKYRNDPSIGLVCGFNPLGSTPDVSSSYFFSVFSSVWGWGTWKRVWDTYDPNADQWLTSSGRESVNSFIRTKSAQRFWGHNFDLVSRNHEYSTWDYQMVFNQLINQRLNIFPRTSLVSNIGFSIDANHTMDVNHPLALVRSQELFRSAMDEVPKVANSGFDLRLEKELFNLSFFKYLALRAIHSLPSESLQRTIFRTILKLRILLTNSRSA
jgi:hypothetical protein